MFYDDDADIHRLDGKTVAIIGYGSQGHAHALNLKDSGVSVVVGLRSTSASVEQARGHGLEVLEPADAASRGDVVMMLVPDELHRQVWEAGVADGVASGNLLLFGHGFSIHYEQVVPPPDVDVGLVAPKGPGHLVRREFLDGSGVPGLVAVHQDATGDALALTLAYAKGIGCTRTGVIETTFKLGNQWSAASWGTNRAERRLSVRRSTARDRRGGGRTWEFTQTDRLTCLSRRCSVACARSVLRGLRTKRGPKRCRLGVVR